MKNLFKTIAVFFTAFAFTACLDESLIDTNHSMVGTDVSSFESKTLEGETVTLSKYKNGKPIVLNVWATWCPPCVRELPSLDALNELGEFQVITIATDKYDDKVSAFLKKRDLEDLTVLRDPQGILTRQALQATQLPMTFILDENMIVRGVEPGDEDWVSEEMVNAIRTIVVDANHD